MIRNSLIFVQDKKRPNKRGHFKNVNRSQRKVKKVVKNQIFLGNLDP